MSTPLRRQRALSSRVIAVMLMAYGAYHEARIEPQAPVLRITRQET